MIDTVECIDRHGNTHIVNKSELGTRISVCGILKHLDRFLLIQTTGTDFWELPGGGLEPGETIEAGLTREFFEEALLNVTIGSFVTLKESFFFSDISERAYFTLRLFYLVQLVGELPETFEGKFVGQNELDHTKINESTRSTLEFLRNNPVA